MTKAADNDKTAPVSIHIPAYVYHQTKATAATTRHGHTVKGVNIHGRQQPSSIWLAVYAVVTR